MKFVALVALAAGKWPAKDAEETENVCRSYTYRYYDHGLRMWRYRTRY